MIPKLEDLFLDHTGSKKLKALGFIEPCIAYYWIDKPTFHYTIKYDNYNYLPIRVSAPLFDQVLRWLELKHSIGIEIALDDTLSWVYRITPVGPESVLKQSYQSDFVYCNGRHNALIDAIDFTIELLYENYSSK